MIENDFISRSALLAVPNVCKVTEYDESGCGISYLAVSVDDIEAAPAVDAEVVRHGRWVYDINNLYGCSECMGREIMSHRNMKNFCPWCGARMDAEVEG